MLKTALYDFQRCSGMHKMFFCLIFIPDLFQCPENFFKCPKHFCIDTRFVCDGIPQCLSGEDEQNCGKLEVYEPARRLTGKSAIQLHLESKYILLKSDHGAASM